MALSEKIAFGFLEEDNPVKSYYRFKPLVLETEGGYEELQDVSQTYPDDGYLRIVPDKNESSHFKARMRRIGRFCMIDLRRHQSESDKIRPNKNYKGDGIERNVNIVYSDVITEIPAGRAAEIISCGDADNVRVSGSHPGSTPFMLECGGHFTGPWRWEPVEGEENLFMPARSEAFEPADGDALPQGEMVQLHPDEERAYTLLIAPAGETLFRGTEPPAAEAVAPEAVPEMPRESKPEAKAEGGSEPRPEPKPEARPEPKSEEKPAERAPAEATHARSEAKPAEVQRPARAGKNEERRPRPERAEEEPRGRAPRPPRPESVEPRSAQMRPAVGSARAAQRGAAVAAQRGLNPKRGISLLEIIDEQWRHSRLDQLGHPVPPEASTVPLMSPVDRARAALKEAWALSEARGGVLDAVLSLDQLPEMLPERLGSAKRPLTQAQVQELDEFEARRLKALQELDQLARARADKRRELLDEVKKENAIELRRLEKQNAQARADAQKSREVADAAADAANAACKALEKISGEQLLEQLMSEELKKRAAAMLRQLDRTEKPVAAPPALLEPTMGELVSDLRAAFEDYGMTLSHDQAVNLLAGVALFDMNVYSGVTGSGKSRAVRLMAQTLGLTDGRFITLHAGRRPAAEEPKFAELNAVSDAFTPLITLIDDANNAPGDPARGLGSMHEDAADGIHPNMKLMLTVQDNPVGYAMNANLLDRAFFVRFDLPGLDLPWKPCAVTPRKPAGAVSMDALRRLFVPSGEITPEVQDRMMTLRRKLADMGVYFSARALSDMHRYITTVQPLMTAPPMQVLDYALAQRAIPYVLATAPVAALHELPKLLADLPQCLKLLDQPLAVPEL
ncbi:MAG: hypothetical protein Q4E13_05465 [Clostridia bacterium]|nr:hypothetical protein [Clostridia bacterium]